MAAKKEALATLPFASQEDWRAWLAANHATSAGVWLQLANKSMLMNQKQGKRVADECKSAVQLQVSDDMRRNPPASVLDESRPAGTEVVKK